MTGDAEDGRRRLGLGSDEPLIVVTGGSLGADGLNKAIVAAVEQLTLLGHVLLVCGEGKRSGLQRARFTEVEYVDEGWGDILAAADVVVSRAGANALFELTALQKKNVLVPLPKTASRGDQIDNAAYAERAGWSLVIQEENLTPQALHEAVHMLLTAGHHYEERMAEIPHPNSTNAIVTEIHAVHRESP